MDRYLPFVIMKTSCDSTLLSSVHNLTAKSPVMESCLLILSETVLSVPPPHHRLHQKSSFSASSFSSCSSFSFLSALRRATSSCQDGLRRILSNWFRLRFGRRRQWKLRWRCSACGGGTESSRGGGGGGGEVWLSSGLGGSSLGAATFSSSMVC